MSFRRFATYIFKTWSSFTEAGTTERYHYNEQFSYLTSQPDGYTKGEGAPLLSSHESRSAIKIIFLFPPLFLVGVAERQQCCSVTLFYLPTFLSPSLTSGVGVSQTEGGGGEGRGSIQFWSHFSSFSLSAFFFVFPSKQESDSSLPSAHMGALPFRLSKEQPN